MTTQGEELTKIIGHENVVDDLETLEAYAKDMSFVPSIRPKYVARPNNAEEVQAIVKWANRTATPLVPVSSGGPHFRGDTVPSIGGAVIVDLNRMKRIIWISGRQGTAIVEPGVTFGELQKEVAKEGLRLNIPLLPRSSKSVLASLLEREPVTMPKFQWEDGDPLGATEVVWANGDLFRTGAGAVFGGTLEDAIASKSAINWPKGPCATDYAKLIQGAQGTMGIVTWASVRCERAPSLQEPFLIGSSNLEHLSEFVYWLLRRRLAEECLVLNNANIAAILAKKWPDEYISLRDTLPPWVFLFSLNGYEYFPEERIAYQSEDMLDIAQRVSVEPVKSIDGLTAHELLKLLSRPSDEPYWKLRYKGAYQDIFFLTTLGKVSELVDVMYQAAGRHGYPVNDIGVYLQPTVQGCSWHCEFNLFFDPNKSSEVSRVKQLFMDASDTLMARGAYFSRPYGVWADMVYRRDAETTTLLRKVKSIFDPSNIMNPGKLCF
jgi:FAD/FMN-containing dehydrogenase